MVRIHEISMLLMWDQTSKEEISTCIECLKCEISLAVLSGNNMGSERTPYIY